MLAYTLFDKMVKIVRTENETKFRCLKDYFDESGIILQTSYVDTPQQNE